MHKNSLKELIKEINKNTSKPDKGYKTIKQLAEDWDLSVPQTTRIVNKGLLKGVIESKKFRIITGDKTYPVKHFLIKTK